MAAIFSHKGETPAPDTGSLRGDLLAAYCGAGGLDDPLAQALTSAVVTAMVRDPNFADIYRRELIGPRSKPLESLSPGAWTGARCTLTPMSRPWLPPFAGIVQHRAFLVGDLVTPELVGLVVDHVILPAAQNGPRPPG